MGLVPDFSAGLVPEKRTEVFRGTGPAADSKTGCLASDMPLIPICVEKPFPRVNKPKVQLKPIQNLKDGNSIILNSFFF